VVTAVIFCSQGQPFIVDNVILFETDASDVPFSLEWLNALLGDVLVPVVIGGETSQVKLSTYLESITQYKPNTNKLPELDPTVPYLSDWYDSSTQATDELSDMRLAGRLLKTPHC